MTDKAERGTENAVMALLGSGWTLTLQPIALQAIGGYNARTEWDSDLYVHYEARVIAEKSDGTRVLGVCTNGTSSGEALASAIVDVLAKANALARHENDKAVLASAFYRKNQE